MAHVASEVDDLAAAIEGERIRIAPSSLSEGVIVAFIEVSGAPAALLQVGRELCP